MAALLDQFPVFFGFQALNPLVIAIAVLGALAIRAAAPWFGLGPAVAAAFAAIAAEVQIALAAGGYALLPASPLASFLAGFLWALAAIIAAGLVRLGRRH